MTLKKAFTLAVLLGAGTGLLLTLHGGAEASRNASGTYSSPSASFVSGTAISSSVMNGKLDDIGAEITDSLSRSGKGGMLARLRGVDGTSALPAYSFSNETTLGLYRAGSGDLRCSSNGTDILGLSSTGIVAYQPFTRGVTVTNSTSNAAGTTSTGNGTGAGMVATGGATGNGGTFTGGATSGAGVVATGTGGGNGGTLTGQGAGAGARGVGGATGPGGSFTGGAAGDGVRAVGGGTANSGIYATGGAAGVGGYLEAGTASTATDPTLAVTLKSGHLLIDATAPNANEALANTLTPLNIPKAWAKVTTTGGTSSAATVNAGFNVSSASVSGATLTVTLASGVDATSAALGTPDQLNPMYVFCSVATATTVTCRSVDFGTGSVYDLQAGTTRAFSVLVFGAQ